MSRSAQRPGYRLGELAERFGVELAGEGDVVVRQVASLRHAGRGDITFLSDPRHRRDLERTGASAVILAPAQRSATSLPRLVSPNPYACYARVAALLNPRDAPAPGIHSAAVVDPSARLAPTATVGPFAAIGPGAEVGSRAHVMAGASIGAEVSIGDDSVIHPRVVVYDRCRIGSRVIIHSGAVIGADGFGIADDGGVWLKIPQIGRVTIGDDVEIGAGTAIDRGALDDTVIEDGVKIDNLVQIAHNCRIGAHTAIAGCVGIAGSAIIGRHCRIGGAAMIAGHLSIADGTTIGGGTLIAGSIAERGVYTGVFPALPHAEWLRSAPYIRQLRELSRRVRELEGRAAKKGE